MNLLLVPNAYTIAGVQTKIRLIAQALGREARGEQLIQTLVHEVVQAQTALHKVRVTPKVLFIYARGQGTLNVSGVDTSAAAMIELAGGRNAVTDYEGFKLLTAEAVVAAAPDVLLLTERGLNSLGGIDSLLNVPGIALTPAGKQRRIVAMEDLYLLGFGPRMGRAVQELAVLLHPALQGDGP